MASKNVLFLVHGIGDHQEGWSALDAGGPATTLVACAEHYVDRFGPEAGGPLTNSLELVEIRYDHIFEEVRNDWNSLASGLTQKLSAGPDPALVGEVAQFISQATDPESWWARYALDAVMYKGFRLVREVVKHSVAAQLASGIASRVGEISDPRFSILAHSLGTAVTHDALQLLGTTAWMNHPGALPHDVTPADVDQLRRRYGSNPFSPGIFRWHALLMVANVAALIAETKPHHQRSIVRPAFSGNDARNNCGYYYNFGHVVDPVARAAPFSATHQWPRSAAEGFAFDEDRLDHFHDPNIHGFSHYLLHPSVHGRVLHAAVPHRFKSIHVAMADARAASGGDFARVGGPLLGDDNVRTAFLGGLAQVLAGSQDLEALLSGFGRLLEVTG